MLIEQKYRSWQLTLERVTCLISLGEDEIADEEVARMSAVEAEIRDMPGSGPALALVRLQIAMYHARQDWPAPGDNPNVDLCIAALAALGGSIPSAHPPAWHFRK